MPTTRISLNAHNLLAELAEKRGESMQIIIEAALEAYRRQLFLEDNNRAFASLRENHEAWQDEKEERSLWDNTFTGMEED